MAFRSEDDALESLARTLGEMAAGVPASVVWRRQGAGRMPPPRGALPTDIIAGIKKLYDSLPADHPAREPVQEAWKHAMGAGPLPVPPPAPVPPPLPVPLPAPAPSPPPPLAASLSLSLLQPGNSVMQALAAAAARNEQMANQSKSPSVPSWGPAAPAPPAPPAPPAQPAQPSVNNKKRSSITTTTSPSELEHSLASIIKRLRSIRDEEENNLLKETDPEKLELRERGLIHLNRAIATLMGMMAREMQ